MAFYRNNETGKVQFHPKSGIGKSLGSTEIAEDGKPVKPRTSLAPSADEMRRAKALLKDNSGTSIETAAAQAVVEAGKQAATAKRAATKTTGSKAGDTKKQEGDQ